MREQVEAYLSFLTLERGLSPMTCASYRQDLAQFETFLGERRISAWSRVQPVHVREFLQALRARRTPATVARKLAAVKGLFRFLEAEGAITRSPTAFIETPRLWRRLPPTLQVAEVERLLASVRAEGLGLRDRAMLELLYGTGLRVSELVSRSTWEASTSTPASCDASARGTRSASSRSAVRPRRRSPGT